MNVFFICLLWRLARLVSVTAAKLQRLKQKNLFLLIERDVWTGETFRGGLKMGVNHGVLSGKLFPNYFFFSLFASTLLHHSHHTIPFSGLELDFAHSSWLHLHDGPSWPESDCLATMWPECDHLNWIVNRIDMKSDLCQNQFRSFMLLLVRQGSYWIWPKFSGIWTQTNNNYIFL